MSLFDIFRKRKPSIPLPQLCYDVAYFILPRYVHHDFAKLDDMCRQTHTSAGPFFYVMACQLREVEPDIEAAKAFQWHTGRLADGREYMTLAYPPPPAVDMSQMSPEQLMNCKNPPVLAPYFSCVLRDGDGETAYYILGQAPLGGGTTLRCITADGANCNLGPGPTPTIEAFHAAIKKGEET